MMPRPLPILAFTLIAVAAGAAAPAAEPADDPARALFEEGRDAFHRAWFERADDLLRQALEVDPELGIAHAYEAASLSLLYGDPAASIERALAASHSTASERLMTEALVAVARTDVASALDAVQRLLELSPDDVYARHTLGFLLVDLGRPEQGAAVLSALLADSPGFVAAWNHLGYAYLDLGDLDRAERAFAELLARDPDNPAAHDSWADLASARLRTDEAIASLTRAMLLEPTSAYAMLHLGDVLAADDRAMLARAAYRRSIEMAPPRSARLELVARERTAAVWARELQLDAARSELERLVMAADRLDDQAAALAALREQLTIDLIRSEGDAARGALDDYARRVDALGDSASTLGEPSWWTFFAGWLSVVEHDLDDAEAMIVELDERAEQGDWAAGPLAARLDGELGLAGFEYADAVEAFEEAGSDDPLLAVRLALAYEGDGKPGAATALYESAASCRSLDVGCAVAAAIAAPLFDLDWSAPELPLLPAPPFHAPEPEEEPEDGAVRI